MRYCEQVRALRDLETMLDNGQVDLVTQTPIADVTQLSPKARVLYQRLLDGNYGSPEECRLVANHEVAHSRISIQKQKPTPVHLGISRNPSTGNIDGAFCFPVGYLSPEDTLQIVRAPEDDIENTGGMQGDDKVLEQRLRVEIDLRKSARGCTYRSTSPERVRIKYAPSNQADNFPGL